MTLSAILVRLSRTASSPATAPGSSIRIVVVDDHGVIRRGVRSVLGTRKNIEIYEASSGYEAIEKALQLHPDLIILDVAMPTMDGLTTTKEIKKLLPTIAIIILSVHDGPGIVRAAQEAGAQGFVTKSAVAPALLKAVDAVLRGETFFAD